MSNLLATILAHLDRGDCPPSKWPDAKGEYWPLCPFHQDEHHGSFSVSAKGFKCFSCDASGGLHKLAEHLQLDRKRLHGCSISEGVTPPPPPPSLDEYAQAKGLDVELLKAHGLETVYLYGKPVIKIPYYDVDGAEVAARLRLALTGGRRFRWRKGSKAQPYGLWRLAEARAAGYVLLVEGESDCHTLWQHGLPALGVPGASTWKPDWAEHVKGLKVYVWREPDDGGDTLARVVSETLPEARILTAPQGRKDPSECHVLGDDLPALLERLMSEARPLRALHAEAAAEAQRAKRLAEGLLEAPDILSELDTLLGQLGLVGENSTARLLYLALTTRLLEEPVSVVLKGPSSSGKSFITETVLRTMPDDAYLDFTSMSSRALVYDDRPIEHRFIVLYEASGLGNDKPGEPNHLAYTVRSLLSEGAIKYTTVEKGDGGMQPRHIERTGPTGLITTTTLASLHTENETRTLSVTVRDDPAQTGDILRALADRANGRDPVEPDLGRWHALQRWLETAGERRVTIPYAHALAERVNPRAVRMRRDFSKVCSLIQAHAILHQCTRERDDLGRIVAALADYRAVHGLVIGPVSEGVEASVSETVRETVEAVAELTTRLGHTVSVSELAQWMRLDKSATSRRVRVALDRGYLVNREERRGRPAQLEAGEPLPDEEPVLPEPDTMSCCAETEREGLLPPQGQKTEEGGQPPRNHCNTATLAITRRGGGGLGAAAGR